MSNPYRTIQDISVGNVRGLMPFNEIEYIDDQFCCGKCNTILIDEDHRFWDIVWRKYYSLRLSTRRICWDCFKTNKNIMKELDFKKYTRHSSVVECVETRFAIWRMTDTTNNESQIVQTG
jgi:hypothetical protein